MDQKNILETLDVMNSKEELEAVKGSLEPVRRGEIRDWDECLNTRHHRVILLFNNPSLGNHTIDPEAS